MLTRIVKNNNITMLNPHEKKIIILLNDLNKIVIKTLYEEKKKLIEVKYKFEISAGSLFKIGNSMACHESAHAICSHEYALNDKQNEFKIHRPLILIEDTRVLVLPIQRAVPFRGY